MDNSDYVEWTKTLTKEQLLDEVMENTEYLTDSYYFYPLGKALVSRYEELKNEDS
jgi:hypothetical protein